MALARVKTWNPGDVLTAADLNAEFNNILNNPISLVSPTTGAINFQTSVAHTNLQVSALTASSGFAGSVLVGSTAATPSPVWSTGAVSGGVFVATTASIPTWLGLGTTGQALIVSSSGGAAWGGPSICKGWAYFTSSGVTGGQQFNVSSVTFNGAGDFTINWSNQMSSAQYTVLTGVGVAATDSAAYMIIALTSQSTAGVRVNTVRRSDGVGVNPVQANVAAFSV